MKKTGATEQALLTGHKPQPHVRRCLSESNTLAAPLIICCFLHLPVFFRLLIFLGSHWNARKVANVEYPSPNRKRNGTEEQVLLTNHKPEPRVRRLQSESTTLPTPLISCYTSFVSFPGWLLIFFVCHWNAEGQCPICLRPQTSPH
uniref:LITAF domain-containing protein n=1 Tax=Mesocestoides corti TaxID=53468 RepID=A0A5K3FAW2_MESCO